MLKVMVFVLTFLTYSEQMKYMGVNKSDFSINS